MSWLVVSGSDRRALDLVDGVGRWEGHGPHYSRRTPGAPTFTGVGQEIVLVTECERAVWAVVLQRVPSPKGSGASRGRTGETAPTAYVWRNMLFRNLGAGLSSDEIGVKAVKSANPGYCYLMAGWERGPTKRGKLHLYAPPRDPPTETA